MKQFPHVQPTLRLARGIVFASLFAAGSAIAGNPPATAAQAIPAAAGSNQTTEVGILQVERHGKHGTPIILVPGLASGAWVWDDTVRRLQATHVVYVVTLPGFSGRPAQAGVGMQDALDSLRQLITANKLKHPVVIGHSLGGVLAFALAEKYPQLLSGVVSIDGLPVFPGTESMAVAQRPAMAAGIQARMAGVDQAGFVAQQLQYMQTIGVLDMDVATRLAALTAKSDPAATTRFMADTLQWDLRSDLPKISVPVLVLSPFNPADGAAQGIDEAAKTGYYRGLMAGTPQLEVLSISPSRHFAMVDQPAKVAAAIDGFLGKLSPR
ncbi:MAG: alpha/beta hydrolase [Arenimonas sp.]